MESISMRSHRSCPSRGAKRRSCLRLVRRLGALSKPPVAQSATKRCSRRRRVGALLLHGGLLDSGLSARADDGTRSQERGKPSPARLALSDSSALRKEGRGTRTGATANSPSFFQVAKVTGARGDSSPQDRPCACTACRRSEEPTFRMGRAHDRIVVAEIGRTASSSWTRAAPGDRGGVPKRNAAGEYLEARVIARPMEGALDHQYLRRPSRVVVSGWSRPRARRPSRPVGGGVSSGKRKPKEGRRSAVTGASEDESSVDVAGRTRPPRKAGTDSIRSAWGVVKRAMHPWASSQGEHAQGSPNETWVPVVEVSLAEAGRTHLWSMSVAFVVKCGRKPRGNGVRGSISATEQSLPPSKRGERTRPR